MMGFSYFQVFSMSWLEFYYFLHLQVQLRDLRECFKNANCALLFSPFLLFELFAKYLFLFRLMKSLGMLAMLLRRFVVVVEKPKTSRDSLKWAKRNSGLQSRIKWTIMETTIFINLNSIFWYLVHFRFWQCHDENLRGRWGEEGETGGKNKEIRIKRHSECHEIGKQESGEMLKAMK